MPNGDARCVHSDGRAIDEVGEPPVDCRGCGKRQQQGYGHGRRGPGFVRRVDVGVEHEGEGYAEDGGENDPSHGIPREPPPRDTPLQAVVVELKAVG